MGTFLFFYVIGGNFERPVFVFCTPLRFRKFLKSALWGFAASSIVAVGSVWSQDGTLSSYESLFDDELFQDVPAPKSTASVASSSSATPASSAAPSKQESQPSVAVSSAAVPSSSAMAPKSSAVASSASKPASSAVAPASSSAVPVSSATASSAVSSATAPASSAARPASSAVISSSSSARSSSSRVVAAAEPTAENVSDEWNPAIKYIPVPKSTSPLDGLLPFGGVGARPGLMNTSKGQVKST